MRIMMFAHNGSLNRGCEAIVQASSQMLKLKYTDCSIILSSMRPDTDINIGKVDKIIDCTPKAVKPSIIEKIRIFAELKLFNSENYILSRIYENTIGKIDNADVCLSIGGDNYCYGDQPWLYEIDRCVKRKGKKLVLWACSIGDEDISTRKLEDLKSFNLIIARESLTYNLLKSKGLNNLKLCTDPAFTLEKEELLLPKGWKNEDTIGLNFSPLVLKRNVQSEYAIKELIKHILKVTDSTIALTPHVTEEGNNDFEVLYKFYQEFKNTNRVIIISDNLTSNQYKGYIGRMRCFIGARTHATIAAYSNYVPCLVLGYSIKSRGIARDLFGEEKLVLGINDISKKDKLIEAFDEMIREEREIKNTLHRIIPSIKKTAFKSADYLVDIMK